MRHRKNEKSKNRISFFKILNYNDCKYVFKGSGSMLTDNQHILAECIAEKRIWQRIPGIEITKNGRIFVTFYSGGTKEQIGNYVALIISDDGGSTFSEPIFVAQQEGHRCFDPCLWIDPKGRLWFLWARYPNDGVFAAICDDPDAEKIIFGQEFCVGHNVMMNKPTILSTGEWVFPMAVWNQGVYVVQPSTMGYIPGSYACVTCDEGKTFEIRGAAIVPQRSFDEHMFLEQDNRLTVFVRTEYGIGTAISYDGGYSWSDGVPDKIIGPSSRFHIRRLPSGRILLVYHDGTRERKNLTAMLSENEGKTWKYKLLLDERQDVSYPDVTIDSNGYLNIIYDRERGGFKQTLDEALSCSRELLMARIREEDILAGKLICEKSYIKHIVNRLGEYRGDDDNPFGELRRKTVSELATYLIETYPREEILEQAFFLNGTCCDKAHRVDTEKLDRLCDRFIQSTTLERDMLAQILTELRLADHRQVSNDVTEAVITYIETHFSEPLTLMGIADKFSISAYYLSHLFKHATGLGVMQFCFERRIAYAKELLLTDKTVTQIAAECGFRSSSRFAEAFRNKIGMTPVEYRKKRKTAK